MPNRSQRHLRELRGKDSRGTVYNHAPTNIALSAATIGNAAAIGTTIGTLTTTDADPGQSFTYQLTSNPSNLFSILGNALKVATALTAGAKPITIRTRDNKGGLFSKNFTITVT